MSHQYQRTTEELEKLASKFWPEDLTKVGVEASTLPLLLKTQDKFIAIVGAGAKSLEDLYRIIESSDLPANLFLKHLSILADFGGEMLKRVSREFRILFPDGALKFLWNEQEFSYKFRALPKKKLSNQTLKIDGKEVFNDYPLSDRQKDAIVLLMFGSAYSDSNKQTASALAKCLIGDYLGKPTELSVFVKQRYIWVSRITGGAESNTLGQAAQKFVAEFIEKNIELSEVKVKIGGTLPKVTHTDPETGRLTSFDIVVYIPKKRYVAIEVSFQVTTNSVIERKAGQAKARYEQIEKAGYKIAYVLDGSGNFERHVALSTICSHSHCTVAFSKGELETLCKFLREELDISK